MHKLRRIGPMDVVALCFNIHSAVGFRARLGTYSTASTHTQRAYIIIFSIQNR